MATELSTATRGKAPVQRHTADSSNPLGIICALIVFLSFAPLFLLHGQRLWALPHYQFFPMVLAGSVVEIAGIPLRVEEACAGVNSLFSLVACCLFLILFLRRPWMRAVLLVIATFGWVLVCNVVRVTLIAVSSDRWHHDLATGLKH